MFRLFRCIESFSTCSLTLVQNLLIPTKTPVRAFTFRSNAVNNVTIGKECVHTESECLTSKPHIHSIFFRQRVAKLSEQNFFERVGKAIKIEVWDFALERDGPVRAVSMS